MFLLLRSSDSGLQRLTARTHRALGQMEQKLPDPQPFADTRYPFQALLTQEAPNNHSLYYPCAPLYLLPGRHLGICTMQVGTSPALPTTEAQAAAGSWVNPQLPLPMEWTSEVKPPDFISTGGHMTRQSHTNTGQAFQTDWSRLCRTFKLPFHTGIQDSALGRDLLGPLVDDSQDVHAYEDTSARTSCPLPEPKHSLPRASLCAHQRLYPIYQLRGVHTAPLQFISRTQRHVHNRQAFSH